MNGLMRQCNRVGLLTELGRDIATPDEARAMLNLKGAGEVAS
jgi:uncharacterized protein (DUF849 family)